MKSSQVSHDPLAILVVDDYADFAAIIAEELSDRGHAVTIAHDGATALSIARGRVFDAVVLDLTLPDISGYAVARTLRQGQLVPETTTIILITGSDDARFDSAEAAGVDMLLKKPIDKSVLEPLVEHVRHRRRRKAHA